MAAFQPFLPYGGSTSDGAAPGSIPYRLPSASAAPLGNGFTLPGAASGGLSEGFFSGLLKQEAPAVSTTSSRGPAYANLDWASAVASLAGDSTSALSHAFDTLHIPAVPAPPPASSASGPTDAFLAAEAAFRDPAPAPMLTPIHTAHIGGVASHAPSPRAAYNGFNAPTTPSAAPEAAPAYTHPAARKSKYTTSYASSDATDAPLPRSSPHPRAAATPPASGGHTPPPPATPMTFQAQLAVFSRAPASLVDGDGVSYLSIAYTPMGPSPALAASSTLCMMPFHAHGRDTVADAVSKPHVQALDADARPSMTPTVSIAPLRVWPPILMRRDGSEDSSGPPRPVGDSVEAVYVLLKSGGRGDDTAAPLTWLCDEVVPPQPCDDAPPRGCVLVGVTVHSYGDRVVLVALCVRGRAILFHFGEEASGEEGAEPTGDVWAQAHALKAFLSTGVLPNAASTSTSSPYDDGDAYGHSSPAGRGGTRGGGRPYHRGGYARSQRGGGATPSTARTYIFTGLDIVNASHSVYMCSGVLISNVADCSATLAKGYTSHEWAPTQVYSDYTHALAAQTRGHAGGAAATSGTPVRLPVARMVQAVLEPQRAWVNDSSLAQGDWRARSAPGAMYPFRLSPRALRYVCVHAWAGARVAARVASWDLLLTAPAAGPASASPAPGSARASGAAAAEEALLAWRECIRAVVALHATHSTANERWATVASFGNSSLIRTRPFPSLPASLRAAVCNDIHIMCDSTGSITHVGVNINSSAGGSTAPGAPYVSTAASSSVHMSTAASSTASTPVASSSSGSGAADMETFRVEILHALRANGGGWMPLTALGTQVRTRPTAHLDSTGTPVAMGLRAALTRLEPTWVELRPEAATGMFSVRATPAAASAAIVSPAPVHAPASTHVPGAIPADLHSFYSSFITALKAVPIEATVTDAAGDRWMPLHTLMHASAHTQGGSSYLTSLKRLASILPAVHLKYMAPNAWCVRTSHDLDAAVSPTAPAPSDADLTAAYERWARSVVSALRGHPELADRDGWIPLTSLGTMPELKARPAPDVKLTQALGLISFAVEVTRWVGALYVRPLATAAAAPPAAAMDATARATWAGQVMGALNATGGSATLVALGSMHHLKSRPFPSLLVSLQQLEPDIVTLTRSEAGAWSVKLNVPVTGPHKTLERVDETVPLSLLEAWKARVIQVLSSPLLKRDGAGFVHVTSIGSALPRAARPHDSLVVALHALTAPNARSPSLACVVMKRTTATGAWLISLTARAAAAYVASADAGTTDAAATMPAATDADGTPIDNEVEPVDAGETAVLPEGAGEGEELHTHEGGEELHTHEGGEGGIQGHEGGEGVIQSIAVDAPPSTSDVDVVPQQVQTPAADVEACSIHTESAVVQPPIVAEATPSEDASPAMEDASSAPAESPEVSATTNDASAVQHELSSLHA